MRLLVGLSLATLVVAAACAPESRPFPATRAMYQYSVVIPTDALRAGDRLPVTWRPEANPERIAATPPTARLCVALAGPYATVDELKSSATPLAACPIDAARVVVASPVVEADLGSGKQVDQELTLPASLVTGYYALLSVMVYEKTYDPVSRTGGGGSNSSSAIVRVIARP